MTLPPYTRNMPMAATYWPPGDNDGFGGITYGAPVSINCRWQDTVELFRGADGQELVSSAVVYVDRELIVKGKLALGTLAGSPPETALEIRQRGISPSLYGDKALNKVWL